MCESLTTRCCRCGIGSCFETGLQTLVQHAPACSRCRHIRALPEGRSHRWQHTAPAHSSSGVLGCPPPARRLQLRPVQLLVLHLLQLPPARAAGCRPPGTGTPHACMYQQVLACLEDFSKLLSPLLADLEMGSALQYFSIAGCSSIITGGKTAQRLGTIGQSGKTWSPHGGRPRC